MKQTHKELLYGMTEKTNTKIGPTDLAARHMWYRQRQEKLNAMKETKQVIVAKLCTADRLELLEHFMSREVLDKVA